MGLFKKNKATDYTIIIGCGRLGATLANTLSDRGKDVLIMDKRKESFRKLAPNFGGLSIVGNGMDFESLHEAGIEKADVVVVVTNDDNANVMIAQLAKNIFKVNSVIARLYDPEREYIYKEFGIETICPAVLSAKDIDQVLKRSGNGSLTIKTVNEDKEEV